MSAISAIGAVGLAPLTPVSQVAAPTSTGAPSFATMIGEGLQQVDSHIRAADQALRTAAAGQEVPVHDLMISMEQARMQLMLAVEVRNRVVEAYQELLRMQL